MQTNTFEAFARLAETHGATALAAVLHACAPGKALPAMSTPDPQPKLNRFRRALEQATGLQIHYDGAFKTWAYGTTLGHRIEHFPRVEHALIAAVRAAVAPVAPLELHIATPDDWAWLDEFHSGTSNGERTFRLFDTRLYWHIPDANMLLLSYTEPREFGQTKPALAGFCFFGRGAGVCYRKQVSWRGRADA